MFWLVWGYLVLMRLWELVRAKRHLKVLDQKPHPEPAFLAMVLLHTGFLVALPIEAFGLDALLNFELNLVWLPGLPLWAWFFACILVLSQVLRLWVMRSLGTSWNTRVVDGPIPICESGPYAWIRHPNYVVVCLEFLAVPALFGLWWSALFFSMFNGIVLFFRIGLEEQVLFQNADWVEKMASKPRFIPRWP